MARRRAASSVYLPAVVLWVAARSASPVVVIAVVVYKEEPSEEVLPPPEPVQVGEIMAEELLQYDRSNPEKPLLMAIKGRIYDVFQSRYSKKMG
uniref:Steroid membrane binding protein-like n=1 Tax=Oryza sativa subsp. japonica TaxID=39947 RepID=Q6Z0I2_ORYSJ|nr:steroid membrane binding protein-like [Oryza sativa Japonica Group]BAD03624.1 steroid membrane binding protein-like [Oryza sativa Japonica Group]